MPKDRRLASLDQDSIRDVVAGSQVMRVAFVLARCRVE